MTMILAGTRPLHRKLIERVQSANSIRFLVFGNLNLKTAMIALRVQLPDAGAPCMHIIQSCRRRWN